MNDKTRGSIVNVDISVNTKGLHGTPIKSTVFGQAVKDRFRFLMKTNSFETYIE